MTMADIQKAFDLVFHADNTICQRLYTPFGIDVMTIDSSNNKVHTIKLDRFSKTLSIDVFDKKCDRWTIKDCIPLTPSQFTKAEKKLDAYFITY